MKFITNIKQLVIVGLLLQSGISVAYNHDEQAIANAVNNLASNRKEDSQLIIAAQKGNVKDLEAALNDSRVNIDEIGKLSGKTALMFACQNGHKRIVEILLSKGANPHVLSEWGSNSAAREAVKGYHVEILKLLLLSKRVNTPCRLSIGYALIEATIKGRNDIVKLLLASGADPNVEGSNENDSLRSTSALIEAININRKDIVQLLLDNGADINMQSTVIGSTPLMLAASRENEAMIKLFLAKGADPNLRNIHGQTALDYAKSERHRAIIEPFMNKEHHLMNAVVNGDSKTVKDLIAAGADPNAVHKNGISALIEAATKGYTDIVKILIDAGADINGKDSFGFTALIRATEKGSADIVKILIDKGAGKDYDSLETAYMMACHNQNKAKIVKLLEPLIADSSK